MSSYYNTQKRLYLRNKSTIKFPLSYVGSGIDVKQTEKKMAPQLVPSGPTANGNINYWVNEGRSVILPCFSYGSPPPLTRYVNTKCYISFNDGGYNW